LPQVSFSMPRPGSSDWALTVTGKF
jgi:hypothetical protein